MMPNIIIQSLNADNQLELLLGGPGRIRESQSWSERPNGGPFISITFEEMSMSRITAIAKGPRIVTIAVHQSWDDGKDYDSLTSILNRVDEIILPLEDIAGSDGILLNQIRGPLTRSRNLTDEGWKTISRNATYGVSYDEYAA